MTPKRTTQGAPLLTKRDFEAISELRYQIRRFLRFSEQAVRAAGITPLQYLLLLHLRGFPGRDSPTVGELAERLQSHHHGAVALVARCEALGLVAKRAGRTDRRRVEVRLAPKGERKLNELVLLHRAELQALRRAFGIARLAAVSDRGAPRPESSAGVARSSRSPRQGIPAARTPAERHAARAHGTSGGARKSRPPRAHAPRLR
jgi:DNA-binding MarR family transcriptional regulator